MMRREKKYRSDRTWWCDVEDDEDEAAERPEKKRNSRYDEWLYIILTPNWRLLRHDDVQYSGLRWVFVPLVLGIGPFIAGFTIVTCNLHLCPNISIISLIVVHSNKRIIYWAATCLPCRRLAISIVGWLISVWWRKCAQRFAWRTNQMHLGLEENIRACLAMTNDGRWIASPMKRSVSLGSIKRIRWHDIDKYQSNHPENLLAHQKPVPRNSTDNSRIDRSLVQQNSIPIIMNFESDWKIKRFSTERFSNEKPQAYRPQSEWKIEWKKNLPWQHPSPERWQRN